MKFLMMIISYFIQIINILLNARVRNQKFIKLKKKNYLKYLRKIHLLELNFINEHQLNIISLTKKFVFLFKQIIINEK